MYKEKLLIKPYSIISDLVHFCQGMILARKLKFGNEIPFFNRNLFAKFQLIGTSILN